MVDLHTHILPGLDDGARNEEEALEMAACAAADGIARLIATPHFIQGQFTPSRQEILAAVGRLNAGLGGAGVPVEVLPGAEYQLEPDLPARLQRGELLTLNDAGRHLLVELPAEFIPPYAEGFLYELQLLGVTPVIAHPERNAAVGRSPDFLRRAVARGALVQVTADSVTGRFGREARRLALYLLREGLAHFVASDAHSAAGRAPVLAPALREVERRLGKEVRDYLLENARCKYSPNQLLGG